MIYALTDPNGEVLKYPYTGDHDAEGVVEVVDVEAPALADGQTLDECHPVLSGGAYRRNWVARNWLTIEPDGLYARITDNGFLFPYGPADVRRDFGVSARSGAIKQMDGEWGVVPVQAIEAPETTPEQIAEPDGVEHHEGAWRQKWTIRNRTADELAQAKARKSALIDQKLNEAFQAGFTPEAGPLAGHTLQTRDVLDRTNWLTSQASYVAAVEAGHGDVAGASFRTAANQTITTTFAEGLSALLGMAEWGATIMGNSWTLKDAVQAAETFAALDAVDIAQGWNPNT